MITNYFKNRCQSVKFNKTKSPLMSIFLGVPQGSVLGPLFFLLMINELALIMDLLCKMFADDTTMGDSDLDLSKLTSRFIEKLKVFLEWCTFNNLEINWTKTYFMFITNKRLKLPKHIIVGTRIVDGKAEDIKVDVVDSFKLLGVTIDNKLNFLEHCANVKRMITKKIFSIKRFFFLCLSVKIHFFKTFILPYFDYCLSLTIYFPPSTFKSLNNYFNFCLLKLFKLKPEFNFTDAEDDDGKIMSDFLKKLQAYDLFTLQSRVYDKLLTFAHGIKNNDNSPSELKENIRLVVQDDKSTNELTQATYELRGGTIIKNKIPETKYETLTFKHFFPRLLNLFKHFDFSLRKDTFRIQITINLEESLKKFLVNFPKFDIKYSSFCFFKKRKNKAIGNKKK